MPPSYLAPEVIPNYLRVFYFPASAEAPICNLGQQLFKDQLIAESAQALEYEECTTEESGEEPPTAESDCAHSGSDPRIHGPQTSQFLRPPQELRNPDPECGEIPVPSQPEYSRCCTAGRRPDGAG